MNLPIHLLQRSIDLVFDNLPSPNWKHETLQKIQWVAHRGADGPGPSENQLPSFQKAMKSGIWGLEFDVRFSKDGVPIVFHDPSSERIFRGTSINVEHMDLKDLKMKLPQIPTLEETLLLLKNKIHLMIEVKVRIDNQRAKTLKSLIESHSDADKFRLLTLDPKLLESQSVFENRHLIYVTELAPQSASKYVLENQWGGLAGHYLLMTNRIIDRHKAKGQSVGAGFIRSLKNGYRQAERGIDWCFSDRAYHLQHDLDRKRLAH